jgi:hypothetical protein
MLACLRMGYDIPTAAFLSGIRNEHAMAIAAIDIAVDTAIREQETVSQRNADLDRILDEPDDEMVAAWNAHIEGWRH